MQKDVLRKFGGLSGRQPYSRQTLAALAGRVPESLIPVLTEMGLGTWGEGKWQSVDPLAFDGLLRQTLRDDPDFAAEDCTALALWGFGDLFCWHRQHRWIAFRVLPNRVQASGLFNPSPLPPDLSCLSGLYVQPGTVQNHYDLYEPDGTGLFKRLVATHGPLAQGQIFAPRLHPAIGGTLALSNFRPVAAAEAVALLHQMEPFALTQSAANGPQTMRKIGSR
jgi:hypothetical protein